MATTRSSNGLDVILDAGRTFIHHQWDLLQGTLKRNKEFRRTYDELSALSDRDLQDLGIARSSIRKLALEASNGL